MASTPREIEQGELYWVESTGGAGVPHPYVVIQEDVLNRSRIDTVVMCALTTNLKRSSEPGNLLLDDGEGNLPKRSVVVVSQICTVKKTELGELIGKLSLNRVEQILDGLKFQQLSFFRNRWPPSVPDAPVFNERAQKTLESARRSLVAINVVSPNIDPSAREALEASASIGFEARCPPSRASRVSTRILDASTPPRRRA